MNRTRSVPISLTRRLDGSGADAGFTVVWLQGAHDMSTSVAVSAAISQAVDLDRADVLVDLSEVTFMDASIVGTLFRARNQLAARAVTLRVRAPSTRSLRLLQICDAMDLLSTWTDEPAERATG